ncbi:MAG: phosphoribosylamine--glycine ligase [Synergistaceae bacterium]|jgi:phosphoribosylamine--glycine ligase|nr:phosphoribosylamine--glycine ligase [Synergistaceae bacterium]
MKSPADTLVLGGGGREHAIARMLSESRATGRVHCAPGNPGIAALAETHALDIRDGTAVTDFCLSHDIDLVVIGPEAPLTAGVADALRGAGIPVFGPGRDCARLEGSKVFAKSFMKRHGIPTAPFDICRALGECERAIERREPPYVIKADGLAAGKGVFLPEHKAEALGICRELLEGRALGDAGRAIVLEDYLPGRELTVFAVTDGKSYRVLPPSRDHKRIYDGDKGPNTGGMGAYSPVALPAGLMDKVADEVLKPTLSGLAAENVPYRGVIYMGLMLREERDGVKISVVEYNVRFGDPEAQAVLPLLSGDFGLLALKTALGELEECPETVFSGHALCVVLAAGGYPGEFKRGAEIFGLDRDAEFEGTYVFHAGTAVNGEGKIVSNGGRVLAATGVGPTFESAKERAYARASAIRFDGMYYRRDIGWSERA